MGWLILACLQVKCPVGAIALLICVYAHGMVVRPGKVKQTICVATTCRVALPSGPTRQSMPDCVPMGMLAHLAGSVGQPWPQQSRSCVLYRRKMSREVRSDAGFGAHALLACELAIRDMRASANFIEMGDSDTLVPPVHMNNMKAQQLCGATSRPMTCMVSFARVSSPRDAGNTEIVLASVCVRGPDRSFHLLGASA